MKKLEPTQQLTLLILILIGAVYFCAMIPFNLTGSETPQMLEVFEVDEYAQYPHVIRMLTPGSGLYQTVRNFLIYQHYYYGYPFYFWSALSILPLKLFGLLENTRVTVCVLRQMLSVLPMILSAGLLVWTAGKFRRILPAVILDVLLLTMPAVIGNDLWWHPESLTLFFLCLTFFFLDRDRMRCGRDFLLSAAFCGAAVGTKYLGLYFALAIPGYLICCLTAKKITFRQLLARALCFVLVMAVFILISDPLLLLPQERADIFRTIQQQSGNSGVGVFLRYRGGFLENGRLPGWVTENYLLMPFLLLALGGLLAGLFSGMPEKRTMTVVFLLYLVTAFIVNQNTAASRVHYLLPILLPLAAQICGVLMLIPERYEKAVSVLLCVLLAVQIGLNGRTDERLLREQIHREETSSSVALYRTLVADYLPLPEVGPERMTRIFRDWKVYFPEQDGYAVLEDWNLGTLGIITEWHPDLILLENENIRTYSDAERITQAVDPERMTETVAFYSAAADRAIPGYAFLLENSFGTVFRKELP